MVDLDSELPETRARVERDDSLAMQQPRVLVTGLGGFVGRRLLPSLKRLGFAIIAVDRNPGEADDAVTQYSGDIARTLVLDTIEEDVDIVIHLAADVDRCIGSDCVVDNVYATHRLCEWAQQRKVSRLLYLSTIAVNPAQSIQPVNERSEIAPSSLYGMTKFLGEQVIAVSGLNYTAMRFTYLCGPGDMNGLIQRLFRLATSRREIELREEERDFLHIDDAVDAITRVLSYSGPQKIFNFGSGTLTSLEELARSVSAACGASPSLRVVGKRHNRVVDWSLADSELGWRPYRSVTQAVSDYWDDVNTGAENSTDST